MLAWLRPTAHLKDNTSRGFTPPLNGGRPAHPARTLLAAHAIYYGVTGIWPLVSLGTFERVTGPKTDGWLVKTVGPLVTAIAGALGVSAWRGEATAEIVTLAAAGAAGFGAIDVVYVARRRIAPIYLLDAAGECALLALWAPYAWRVLRMARRR